MATQATDPQATGPQKLGPLTPLVGEWEGDTGVDISFSNTDNVTTTTGYFEKAWFKPIPLQENGLQKLWGLKYGMVAWRHGEEAMDPFHDEIGYLLWDKTNGQVMRSVVFGRGIAILAGSSAGPRDRSIEFNATPGAEGYGIAQNNHLLERAKIMDFKSRFTFNDDGSFSYTSDLLLRLAATGGEMNHTDENTLHRVRSYHPGAGRD